MVLKTRRQSAMVAVGAAIIWTISTMSNMSNAWDLMNFSIRRVSGLVAVIAGARWITLTGEKRGQGVTRGRRQVKGVARSAGSRTMLDNLRQVFGRRRTAEQDRATVLAGGAVLVVAYLMERKVRRVALQVGLDEPSIDSMVSVLGSAPYRVFGTEKPTRGTFEKSVFMQINGSSASGDWSISVPTVDVGVVRHVLQQVRVP